MKFSLKNKNRRVRSAVHRAVSVWKLDSLPVNHPKPKIKVGICVKHLRAALTAKPNLNYIDLSIVTLTKRASGVKTPITAKKAIDSVQLWESRL